MAFIWIYPLASVVGLTFNRVDAVMMPFHVFPRIFTLEVYERLVTRYHMEVYVWNTLKVASGSALLTVLSATMAGYALGKTRFRGRDTIFLFVLATMLLPAQATMAPNFRVVQQAASLEHPLGADLAGVRRRRLEYFPDAPVYAAHAG